MVIFFAFCFISIVILLGVHSCSKSDGYRQGQIDVLNGKVNYKLVESPDGSKNWEYSPVLPIEVDYKKLKQEEKRLSDESKNR